MNKIFKGLIRFLIEVIGMTVLIVGINIFTNGMYLWGLPRINDIQSVNITYPSVTDDVKEISSSEDIELALKLTGFLKYDLFGEVNSEEEPAITITYFLKDGTSKTISANNTTVWWNNKIHVIKDKEMFINLTAQANIDLAKKKKSKLLELVTLESITPADFKAMTTQCNQEIKSGEQVLLELKDQQESSEEFRANMEHLRKVLRDAEKQCQTEAITKDFIDTFIDRIYVTPEDDNTLRLDIKIFTGDTCEKYLGKLKRRANPEGSTGHTFKNILMP